AATHHKRHAGRQADLLPERRYRTFEIDVLQRSREPVIIVRDDPAVLLLERTPRELLPFLWRERGKLRSEQAAQKLGAFLEVPGLRQPAEVALDAHQSARLDHRPDVVENDAGNRRRTRRAEQHREDSAA